MKIKRFGGCHCGAVRFEVMADERPQVSDCNCSICSKTGYLHLMVDAEAFHLVSGIEHLTPYEFGTGVAKHYFCKRCGIKSFYVPGSRPTGYSVNLRCLDDADSIDYSVKKFDGQNWEQQFAQLQGKH